MKTILTRLFNHEELTAEESRQILLNISRGMYPEAQIAALLTVFQMRGITVDELTGFRKALMETRVPIDFAPYRPIDIVGTGGDGKNTFNISTCACFIVAGAGYKVAKHGNYGATSVSGASNVIEQHGVRFTNNPDILKRSMEECNIAYLHAQLFNPAMKTVGSVRKALGVRTLFNLLGPLVNPCKPAYQLLGVADLSQMRLYTNVFYKLGIDFAVVNSLDNYDEISLTDEFKVMTRNYERIYRPQALGFSAVRPEELSGGACKEDAARIFDNVLNNRAEAAQTQCVIVNAAFAIQVMEPEKEIEECIAIARESLESGRALKTLKKFIEISKG
ncbi:anthranilate phosphoribosyltransferase [Bacteroides clarus]|jgi:anthranilate phosphoribosyltransferase|uniref:anthranilate phosphoribosyltransferase n=1 Tax=Bacteroides clarus TaxID=626929 RepID=UPI00266C74D3|nr:anthranilate phosphoribosyltransferase [Bacteroides clarus]